MYQFEVLTPEAMSARSLALSLLSTTGVRQQSMDKFLQAGTLFGIEPVAMRVAITRLVKEGLLENVERGVYRAGAKAKALTEKLQNWQQVKSQIGPWDGDWLIVLVQHIGRSDRKRLRARERAMRLNGYSETGTGLWVRPANLVSSIAAHRDDLVSVGLDEIAIIVRASQIAPDRDAKWLSLWSSSELENSYQATIDAITGSKSRLDELSIAEAAKETLLIGQSVIQVINFDPLLPEEIAPAALFDTMLNCMVEYNEIGIARWRSYWAETA